jgi:uncharacterized membrane protein
MNPFDIKQALFARHAQHVVLIHFPIALFIAGAAFDLSAQWTKREGLAAAAYYNFLLAAAATVPAVFTGLLAWQIALDGQRLKGVLLLHLVFGLLSSALIWVVCIIHLRAGRRQGVILPRYRFPIELLTVAVVALTGHLGGFLSGVNFAG